MKATFTRHFKSMVIYNYISRDSNIQNTYPIADCVMAPIRDGRYFNYSIWVRYEFILGMIFDTAINIFHDKYIRKCMELVTKLHWNMVITMEYSK